MRAFFDTNVLVYLFDADAPTKREIARSLLEGEAATGRVLLSTQVLQEFYVTVTRKLESPLGSTEAAQSVRELAQFPLVQVDAPLVLAAIDTSQRLGFSFRDALIVRAALQGGAEVLYTENLQDGQKIDGMTVKNPFG